ncbi:redox-sensing transcriptional repressor Rex [Agilicoccus flavus]|uniref:redox-sensing transcriptional repressor Rex n=1 Tax=Agilicoccus flavus TaxID=2775968 RepID=UPI001CF715F0|nr:redox-sensing transcriptional repressor Rex [Agilicoccus flavus]
MPAETTARRDIPDATVARIPEYLRALAALGGDDLATVSSVELAAAAGVGPAQLRKDLSYLGAHGVRGVGYDARTLAREIGARLGVSHGWPVVLVGAGRLGRALADHSGLSGAGFEVVAVLDRDPAVVGRRAGGLVIEDVARLTEIVSGLDRVLGVVATSAAGAQSAADALVAAGVTSMLTLAPGTLAVPAHVHVRRLDVAHELQILAFHAENGSAPAGAAGMPAAHEALTPGGVDRASGLDAQGAPRARTATQVSPAPAGATPDPEPSPLEGTAS